MKNAPSVLVVEDSRELSEAVREALAEAGYAVEGATTLADATRQLREGDFHVALLDLGLPDGSGLELLTTIADEGLLTEAVVVTGQSDVATAVRAMRMGACDYLVKPTPIEELTTVTAQAVERGRLRRENVALRVRLDRHEQGSTGIVTEDPGMRAMLATLQRVAPTDLPVLVLGESGTGKELVARAVHDASTRKGGPFVAINCAALPENLLESELFGYERGAFTGALVRKPGLFEVADGGTLLLDEIGEFGKGVQAKLLRVLETGEFYRVGSTRPLRTSVRIVAATNRDLAGQAAAGEFREDLYYRLNGVSLELPPLRERRADVLPLALHFLKQARSRKSLGPRALEALKGYDWPGNVRELQMVVRRADILCDGDEIGPEHVPLTRVARRGGSGELPSGLTLAELEERYIRKVLKEHDGQRGKAAQALGIDVKTLYNRLKRSGED
ncbi:MAG: sigma-54 dependent transcriptional regulator [Vicinamibacteria bacterium]|nr:sigma-54 dependent transcriptional regulator [Vicinamibacteria bacterium]